MKAFELIARAEHLLYDPDPDPSPTDSAVEVVLQRGQHRVLKAWRDELLLEAADAE